MHNGEVICIHIGQAGLQMGQAAWELLAAEHGIRSDGTKKECLFEEGSYTTFFQETPSGQYVPRSLFVDLEPTVIDEIRIGNFGRIFHPDLMVSGMEDSGSNYARARYTRGMHVVPLLIDKVRYVAESCDSLQGFMLFSSFGGGTGSGLGALFLNRLEHEFHRLPRIHVGIFPGPDLSPVVVEPYNSVLFASDLLEQADFSILLDNTALCNVIKMSLGIDKPNYSHLNRLSAQIISHLTSTLRFPNTLNNSLHEMQVNLIPYPQIKFPVSAFSPIQCLDRNRHETMGTDTLTRSVFSRENLMVSCNLKKGLFMANSMIYRGPFDAVSVNQAIMCIKRESNWVTWCPTGFKIGLSNQKPMFINSSMLAPSDRSVFMISNTTAVRQVLQKLRRKCCLMYSKQAFVHHYTNEGLEEDELRMAYEEISKLESLYSEIQALDHDGNFEYGEWPSDKMRLAPPGPTAEVAANGESNEEGNEEMTQREAYDTGASQEETSRHWETREESDSTVLTKSEVPDDERSSENEGQSNRNASAPDATNNNLGCERESEIPNKTEEAIHETNPSRDCDKNLHRDAATGVKCPGSKRRSKLVTKFKIHLSKLVKW